MAGGYSVVLLAPEKGALTGAIAALSTLRAQHAHSGLIVSSAEWNQPAKLAAIRAGCDHCVTPEIDPEELAAMAAALHRRHCFSAAPATMTWGPISIDFIQGIARVAGELIEAQPLQLRILGLLMANAGTIITHERLLGSVFRAPPASASNSIARQISVLRQKLGPARGLLVTTRGGYGLDLASARAAVARSGLYPRVERASGAELARAPQATRRIEGALPPSRTNREASAPHADPSGSPGGRLPSLPRLRAELATDL